jgi:cytochrome c
MLLAIGAALAAPVSLAADSDRLARGEQIYGRCAACHAIEQHRTGPAHCGLFGRKAGSAPGFDHYSPALKASGIVWNDKTLANFLASPMTVVPGTNMTYLGIRDAGERADLIAWMREATQAGKHCKPPQ